MKKIVKKKNAKDIKQEKTLIITFIGLIVLVAILLVVVLNLDNIYKEEKKDLTIPILETNFESNLSVEIEGLSKENTKEYILVVTNYKDNQILNKELIYNVEIIPSENTIVKAYKNNESKNLLEEDSIIKNNKLKENKKIKDTYKIIIEAKKEPKEGEKITIKVNS